MICLNPQIVIISSKKSLKKEKILMPIIVQQTIFNPLRANVQFCRTSKVVWKCQHLIFLGWQMLSEKCQHLIFFKRSEKNVPKIKSIVKLSKNYSFVNCSDANSILNENKVLCLLSKNCCFLIHHFRSLKFD